ncbi:sulfotransferase family 2 domain-containing protein [Poseidonocella sedimentorum]|uniref:Sulfotransferase family protein n=1 Tax=Poseidonocella sedimentorum TaxID=871652 RepID=A0A1I6DRS3_9RHOB|nr:sulfotransferase family 2 domain-containing protein [Poseidonocella sedimentorum]SFR08160.1 Sulfotransferase family protein [Poseidonocella sedimentorum]
MPLYRTEQELFYFVHVPKCAGTTVTEYLAVRFGTAAFEDRAFRRDPPENPWTRSSPQHIDARNLERILPREFYDSAAAIVRHPESRLVSAFKFQKRQKTIPRRMSLERWLYTLPRAQKKNAFVYDNHTRPMVEFLPKGCAWFKLEDGLGKFVDWLDNRFGPAPEGISLGHVKKSRETVEVSDKAKRLIVERYAIDYETFGYGTAP